MAFDRGAWRRDALDRWGAALSRGDTAEVDRIVQQSHHDDTATTPPPGLIGELPTAIDSPGERRAKRAGGSR